ncbi:Uncharacterised protein [Mycobacteroides abscessus]|nr:Uncharacterised protein [Mycobacteroides abscessus]
MPRRRATCASDRPCFFASRSTSSVSAGASATAAATSLTSWIWSRYHGSIFVASNTCSTLAPARSACWTPMIRFSVGRAMRTSSSSSSAPETGSPSQWKTEPPLSIERSALPSASVKLRPSAIASPTDFMVVVSVGSAAGNFSNANRGTLTTT